MAQVKLYEVTVTRKVWSTAVVGSLKDLNTTEQVKRFTVEGTSANDVQERVCAPIVEQLVAQRDNFLRAYFCGDASVKVAYSTSVRVLWSVSASGMGKGTAAKAVAKGKASAAVAKAQRRKARQLANKAKGRANA